MDDGVWSVGCSLWVLSDANGGHRGVPVDWAPARPITTGLRLGSPVAPLVPTGPTAETSAELYLVAGRSGC